MRKLRDAPAAADVCAVITTYRPDSAFVDRVSRITSQVGLVVIVDDGESAENVSSLQAWFGDDPHIVLIHNPMNRGIATALNNGVTTAINRGFQWILTLDDDSVVSPAMVQRLLMHLRRASNGKPLGLIGMSFSHLDTPDARLRQPAEGKPALIDKRHIITSGSLFCVSTYTAVGPFREEFVIDWVDYDYCLRARAKGFRVVKTAEIGFAHRIGNPTVGRLFGIPVQIDRHSASRLYYWFRNSVVLAVEYLWTDPLFAGAILIAHLKMLWLIIWFGPDKNSKLLSAFRGIVDGGLNRLGARRSGN